MFQHSDVLACFNDQEDKALQTILEQVGARGVQAADLLAADAAKRAASEWDTLQLDRLGQRMQAPQLSDGADMQDDRDDGAARASLTSDHHRQPPDEIGRSVS